MAGAAALDNMVWTMEAGQLNGQYRVSLATPQALTRTVQDFLSQAAVAVVLETAPSPLTWHNPDTPRGGWRLWSSKLMKTFTCRCKDWTTGRAWNGIMPAASFLVSGISAAQNSALKNRCFFSWPRH